MGFLASLHCYVRYTSVYMIIPPIWAAPLLTMLLLWVLDIQATDHHGSSAPFFNSKDMERIGISPKNGQFVKLQGRVQQSVPSIKRDSWHIPFKYQKHIYIYSCCLRQTHLKVLLLKSKVFAYKHTCLCSCIATTIKTQNIELITTLVDLTFLLYTYIVSGWIIRIH